MHNVWTWWSVLAAHAGQQRCYLVAIIVVVFAPVALGVPGAGAQDGTPSAGLDVPAAAECTVEPRSEDELRALFHEVAATPLPASLDIGRAEAPTGTPADAQTVAEINAAWRMYIACINTGDQ